VEERGSPVIVADTNLLFYLRVGGKHRAAAEAVFGRDPLWAMPLLWRSEFRNALTNLVRMRALGLDEAIAIAREAEERMAGYEYPVASHEVLTLASRSGCSAYDCEFVALAGDLGVPLVTSDGEILRAFPDTAQSPDTFLRRD
jgi:predicted nucleic acid-binding protein